MPARARRPRDVTSLLRLAYVIGLRAAVLTDTGQFGASLRWAPVTTPDVDAAARFLAGNARVLDRSRFERLFSGGDARPVRDAVAAFRNSDGGFGHALEPDGRTPASQPAAVAMALGTLDEADAWDEELVAGACEGSRPTRPPRAARHLWSRRSRDGRTHRGGWRRRVGRHRSSPLVRSRRRCMRAASSIGGSMPPRTCSGIGSTISTTQGGMGFAAA